MKYDSSGLAINNPCGGALGKGKCSGVAVRVEKSGRGGCYVEITLLGRRKVGGELVWQKEKLGDRSGGSEFWKSVNGLPKSIEWNTNQPLAQMEKNSVVVNAQLNLCS
ncbi:hypothetical protein AVEN_236756-1 [Araneus ventricosus]|uniref:Uncharacterized protein n=1 Tax=Araneus ventricosus TaxID=182803 RepID=A0A4Y2JBD5_ARAVE|nr:hypothetical protein AVEN_236756-1 [Araneus ventricosus]